MKKSFEIEFPFNIGDSVWVQTKKTDYGVDDRFRRYVETKITEIKVQLTLNGDVIGNEFCYRTELSEPNTWTVYQPEYTFLSKEQLQDYIRKEVNKMLPDDMQI